MSEQCTSDINSLVFFVVECDDNKKVFASKNKSLCRTVLKFQKLTVVGVSNKRKFFQTSLRGSEIEKDHIVVRLNPDSVNSNIKLVLVTNMKPISTQ